MCRHRQRPRPCDVFQAAKQKEEDRAALERYRRADETKVRELTAAVSKLTAATHASRIELEYETTTSASARRELDRAAEEFKTAHAQRATLVKRWEEVSETPAPAPRAFARSRRTHSTPRCGGRRRRRR